MDEQETIKKLKEQVKALREERNRFERMLHDEREYSTARFLNGQKEEFYLRMRTVVRSMAEHTYEAVRGLRSHLPAPSDIDYLYDTDWTRLNNLVPQLRTLANEIEELDRQRGLTVDASIVESNL